MRKPAPLDTAAIERATRFDATIFLGTGKFRTEPFETLHAAREAAERFAREVNNGRKGMIYAITQDGRSVFVPADYQPTTGISEMTTLSGTEIAKLTAMIVGGGFKRANSKDSAEKRLRAVAAEKGVTDIDRVLGCQTFEQARSTLAHFINHRTPSVEIGASKAAERMTDAKAKIAKAKAAKPASAPKAPKPAAAAKAPAGKRAAALEAAQRGEIPEAPDFTANTHKPHRAKLATVIGLVEKGDIAGLKAFAINPISSSPKAIAKYRDLAVIALEARDAFDKADQKYAAQVAG